MVKRPENGETKIQNGNQQLEFFFFFRGVLSNMGLSPLVPAFFFSGTGGTPWVSGGMNKYGDLPAGRRVHDEEVGRPSHHKGSKTKCLPGKMPQAKMAPSVHLHSRQTRIRNGLWITASRMVRRRSEWEPTA